ncbi:MAG: tRNA (N6-isopentenyl adenosine(37)-C2)-methylthiotransferase MiaB [Peptococcaceae bacterium]|nr:tRNA (N6-isopentenyl adenosine(37)-C2)-methylthiotransferase MiaB [Peptococcaceae bacterium]
MYIQAFGCQMSVRDSESLRALAEDYGFTETNCLDDADLILLTTCCVRESAERKILGRIGELKALKQNNPDLLIVVCGCMVQQPEAVITYRKKAPHVDLWTGTFDYDLFADLLERAMRGEKVVQVSPECRLRTEFAPNAQNGKLKASVSVMYGCDNYCAYCIVPYVRGRERSRDPEDVLAQVEALAAGGCRDLTLLGQNVNSYGIKDGFHVDFADLLEQVDAVAGLERIWFVTSHPKDLSDKLIDVMARCPHVCEHLHLPLQAGSDRVLRAMNRGYTTAEYEERVRALRRVVPGVTVSSDIIVGFPGETEDDFQRTLDVVERVGYTQAFTFMFSKRSGTRGAELPDQIPLDVKKERLARLMELQNAKSLAWRQSFVGRDVEVLVEGTSKNNPGRLMGRTRGNDIVVFPVPALPVPVGELVQVHVEKARSWTLIGRLCD